MLVGAVLVDTGAAVAETLRIPVDKAQLIRLDSDAASVLIADPDIADVAIESPRLIFIVGRRAGETNIFILDGDGREIMNPSVVVVPNLRRRVTVERGFPGALQTCARRCSGTAEPSPGAAASGATAGAAGSSDTTDRGPQIQRP